MNANELRHLRSLARRRVELEAETDRAIRELVNRGENTHTVAKELGVSQATVSRRARR